MMRCFLILFIMLSGPTCADVLIALRNVRAQEIVTMSDFRVEQIDIPGAAVPSDDINGLEARVALYAGRPVLKGDLGPPALVDRNDIVTLVYTRGGLQISAEGRALSRGGAGDTVRVMNLSSRTTITGRVTESGIIEVR